MGEGERGSSRLSVVVRETLSEEGTIWGLYIHTLGVVWNINYLEIVHTALCMECGPQLFGDSTLDYWGIVLGVELITGWVLRRIYWLRGGETF